MADQLRALPGWTIARYGDDVFVVSPEDGPGGGFFRNAGRLEERVLYALADAILTRIEAGAVCGTCHQQIRPDAQTGTTCACAHGYAAGVAHVRTAQ